MTLQGAIVAAGRGERLRKSVQVDLPKPLVELGGEPLLLRQVRAMCAAGASSVLAVINSETADLIQRLRLDLPAELTLIVRDTANSMESLLTLGEHLAPGPFVLATVDAMMPPGEFKRFVTEAVAMTALDRLSAFDGVLAVAPFNGEKRPLFANVMDNGLITRLGGEETSVVTAGIYLLPTSVFRFAAASRRAGLDAMRRFLALLIKRGVRLGALEVRGAIDIDEAADLEAARATLREPR